MKRKFNVFKLNDDKTKVKFQLLLDLLSNPKKVFVTKSENEYGQQVETMIGCLNNNVIYGGLRFINKTEVEVLIPYFGANDIFDFVDFVANGKNPFKFISECMKMDTPGKGFSSFVDNTYRNWESELFHSSLENFVETININVRSEDVIHVSWITLDTTEIQQGLIDHGLQQEYLKFGQFCTDMEKQLKDITSITGALQLYDYDKIIRNEYSNIKYNGYMTIDGRDETMYRSWEVIAEYFKQLTKFTDL